MSSAADPKLFYIEQLEKNKLYQQLKTLCASDSEGAAILNLVQDAILDSCTRTKLIVRYMKEYTLHDEVHLFRVLALIELLIPLELTKKLSLPELMLLILSAFFHDLGMAPSSDEFEEWSKCFDLVTLTSDYESKDFSDFKSFCEGQNYDLQQVIALYSNGKITQADQLKDYWISEFIRKTHASRARKIIAKYWNGKIKYHDVDLTNDFAQLCYSHNQSASFVSELDSELLCGQDVYVSLPFVAVILRLADILDFDAKRTPAILFSQMNVKNPISIKEWNKHRAIQSWEIKPGYICFHAKCSHPAIEATIKEFCDLIDKELILAKAIFGDITHYAKNNKKQYDSVQLPAKVDRSKIEPERDIFGEPKYLFRNTQFLLEKGHVIDLLMGTKLYGKTDVPLRELVQNSIDACLLRQALQKKWAVDYTPTVSIKLYEANDDLVLEVNDNGIGMDQEIIDKFYSRIGSSFYKSPEFYELKAITKANFQPTSRFGIGILSCFMITDEIHVETKRIKGPAESSPSLNLTIQGYDSIFFISKGNRILPGTFTRLYLKHNNTWALDDLDTISQELRDLFPNPPFEIEVDLKGRLETISSKDFSLAIKIHNKPEDWDEHENIRILKVDSISEQSGIACSGFVGFLENKKQPVQEIIVNEKEVSIDWKSYTLNMSVKMAENSIKDESDSITLNSDGDIDQSSSYRQLAESHCKLSLHGILIPMNLFPDIWSRSQKVQLRFPFACDIKVDVLFNRDLDLNSARTEIIYNDKWADFYNNLCILLCTEIKKNLSKTYWNKLKKIFQGISTDKIFKTALKEI
jgi:molecular chaperone HtpG